MAKREYVARLKQGVAVWNAWRQEFPRVWPDLSGANLDGANLREINLISDDLSYADLNSANLSYADLSYAKLRGANLIGTDLSYADLINADLSYAKLNGANLSGAKLSEAKLNSTNLSGTKLHRVHLHDTVFVQVDFCTVEGLDTVIHDGRSSVDVNTVKLPLGEALKHFLRGVGFSDPFIDSFPLLLTTAIRYASRFISYAHQDETLARRLYKDLQDKGVRCWFAPEDMKVGDKIRPRIDEAIHRQDKLLLLLSQHALASFWVEDEVESAMEKENQQQREVLFPVRLDDVVMQTTQAWAAKLRRTRHIGDFTN